MIVMDIGCGMGFFSLSMAELVGSSGKVICIDLQREMIKGLLKRAEKKNLLQRIDARVCSAASLGLGDFPGKIDFAILFALAHEVPDKKRLFSEVHAAMKPGKQLLVAEPRGHVSEAEFAKTVSVAQEAGFEPLAELQIRRSRAVLMQTQMR